MRIERFWIRSVGSLLTFLLVLCTVAFGFLQKKKKLNSSAELKHEIKAKMLIVTQQ